MASRPQAHELAGGSSLTITVLTANTALIAASPIVSIQRRAPAIQDVDDFEQFRKID
jgi:hypothetical protein